MSDSLVVTVVRKIGLVVVGMDSLDPYYRLLITATHESADYKGKFGERTLVVKNIVIILIIVIIDMI